MVKINVKQSPVTGDGAKGKRMQLEVFPQRLLNFETAQKVLDELNEVDGIVRMVVYGPSLPRDDPEDLLDGRFGVREPKFLNIKGEQVELTVQVGRIWIEIEGIGVKEKVSEACERALPFPFEVYEGLYIRTRKTVTDYVRKGGDVDDISLGMFDPKAKNSKCCGTKAVRDSENEQA